MTVARSHTLDVMAGGLVFPERFPSKQQDGVKRYAMNWLPRLGATETLSTAEWRAVEGDLVFENPTINGLVAEVQISQGNQDIIYSVGCKVTTGGGETIEVIAPLQVRRDRL